jgi:hypothetical protein
MNALRSVIRCSIFSTIFLPKIEAKNWSKLLKMLQNIEQQTNKVF